MFKISDGRDYFYQWDTGIVLNLTGTYADTINEVHFCHKYSQKPLTVAVKHDGEVPTVAVPNILLQSARSIVVYAFCRSNEEEYTRLDEVIRVEARPKPANYVYEETEILDYKELSEQFLEELEKVNDKTSMLSRQKVSLPKDGAGNVINGTKGQVATSDGNGGVTWQDGVAKPDWNQSDENAADFIKNRPFYDNTITYLSWDGSTEGLISVDAGDLSLYKVCDYISKDDLLKSTAVIIEDSNAFEYNITQRDITDIGDNCYVAMNFIYVIAADNYSVDGLTFPKAGVYTLTPDATGGSYVAKIYKRDLKQIDVKYIPTTVNGKNADETGAITLNNKDVGATKLIVVTYDGSTNVATMSSKEIQAEHNAGNVIVFSANDGKDLYNLIECTNDGLYARFSSVKQSEDLHTPYVKFVKIDYAKSITYESIDLMPLPVDTEGNTIKHTEGQVYGYTDGRYNWITPVTSWNQLEDKPFGEEATIETIIPLTSVNVTSDIQEVSGIGGYSIKSGDTYVVYIDDVPYECTDVTYYLGNQSIYYSYSIPDNYDGPPFYINSYTVCLFGLSNGTHTISVKHKYNTIVQLNEKYVPYVPEYDNVFTINAVQVSSSYDSSTNSYTVTPDKTYKEMMEAVAAGKNVQVIVIPDDDPNDVWYFTLATMYGAQSAYFISISNLRYRTLWWNQDNATSTYTMTLNLGGYIASKEYVDEQAEPTLPLIVNITETTTGGTTTYSADKTFAEIKEAYDSGRDVILTNGDDTEKTCIPLYGVINDGVEIYMFSYTYSNGESISGVTFMIYDDNGNTVVYNAGSYCQNIPSSGDMEQWNKAQPNQNAFSYVEVDSVRLSANTTTDMLQLVKGANVSFAVDKSKKQITIAATDTTYSPATTTTDGLMSVDDKVKLDGLPTVTTSDNGKILQVVDGQWTLVDPSTLVTDDGNGNVTL